MIDVSLKKMGFSPTEIKIYIHLLKRGNSYPNKISFETGTNRTNVYEALNRLVLKGVVSYVIKNKVKWFDAKSPDSLLSIINEKEEEYKKIRKKLIKDINIIKNQCLLKNPLEASIFVGKTGLRIMLEEMLVMQGTVYVLASQYQLKTLFGHFFEKWHKTRIKKEIKQKAIFPKKFMNQLPQRKLLEYRFIDDEFFSPTTTIIYSDVCLFIEWSNEPLIIKIQNKNIAKSHLNYFKILWKSGISQRS